MSEMKKRITHVPCADKQYFPGANSRENMIGFRWEYYENYQNHRVPKSFNIYRKLNRCLSSTNVFSGGGKFKLVGNVSEPWNLRKGVSPRFRHYEFIDRTKFPRVGPQYKYTYKIIPVLDKKEMISSKYHCELSFIATKTGPEYVSDDHYTHNWASCRAGNG